MQMHPAVDLPGAFAFIGFAVADTPLYHASVDCRRLPGPDTWQRNGNDSLKVGSESHPASPDPCRLKKQTRQRF